MIVTNRPIQILPELVISQIAAGEVIRRPASAAKEMLENALDAGATNIKLIIEDGGKKCIQVTDDGEGMSPEDAKKCFSQHATSKISTLADLSSLQTYGFRGEAMSALRSAAARVVLMTRRKERELGTKITLENGKIKKQEPVAMEKGTQIAIHHLFGNIPARLHFLKSQAIESSHIIDAFQRIALARPDTAFSLYQNKKQIYELPTTKKLSQRIIHLLGASYKKQLIPCEEETDHICIRGYIGRPDQARKRVKKQFFFVNKRCIKSFYLNHAVKKAFENLLPPESAPFYALFIDINPEKIDINVHPTKMEVSFEEEKLLYALIQSSIRKALSAHHIIPSIDFQNDTPTLFPFSPSDPSTRAPAHPPRHEATEANEASLPSFFPAHKANGRQEERATKWSHTSDPSQPSPDFPRIKAEKRREKRLQVHQKFIVSEVKSGILLIDQQLAYERILYEERKRNAMQGPPKRQQLLFPIEVTLDPADFTLIQSGKETIRESGFDFKVIKNNTLVITAQPAGIKGENLPDLFASILEEYKTNMGRDMENKESWVRAVARKAGAQYSKKLSPEEIDDLVERLFSSENPNYTPAGKVIWRIISTTDLSRMIAQNEEES